MSGKSGYWYLKRKVAQQLLTIVRQNEHILDLKQREEILKRNEEKGWNAAHAYWQHMGWFRRWLWYRKHKS